MPKLRLILLLLLLLVPPLLLAGSYVGWLNFDHFTGHHAYSIHVGNGGVYFIAVNRANPPSWNVAYGYGEDDYQPAALRERWRTKTLHYFDPYSFAGFGLKPYAPDSAWATNCGMIRFPFWILLPVCLLLAFGIVRREERKRAAFPVEVEKQNHPPKPLRKSRW